LTLQIFNTLGHHKQNFKPLQDKKVKMYVCGPTVYDLLHVGNFRGAIFFNLVRNWLEYLGYRVTFVYNYTDIDDKIINRAREEGVPALELSRRYIAEFEKDFASLKLKAHEHNPKCSDHMSDMIKLIGDLIKKGHAYAVDGSVFYAIDSFKNYGRLSGKNIDELQAGHRVDPDPRKRNALDFVLWKPSKEGEPAWDSPWGAGRPGWHIECSAMNRCIHGDQVDIHGGGLDLIFPHHENEIAQSEGATGKPLANFWMHNNFIKMGDEKMSKSLGNVVRGRDFIEKYHPEILKFMILSVHYRSFLNLAQEQVYQAIAALARIYAALLSADEILAEKVKGAAKDNAFAGELAKADKEIEKALNDDFNTPAMFAAIFDVVRNFNAGYKSGQKVSPDLSAKAKMFKGWLVDQGKLLALFQEPPAALLKALDDILIKEYNIDAQEVEGLINERNVARAAKDFQKADQIREQLNGMNILIHDGINQTTWEVKKG